MTEPLRLGPSVAKVLLNRSPLHAYRAHRETSAAKPEPAAAQLRGSILDRMLFGVGPDIVVIAAESFRTKEAKQARGGALAFGQLPILFSDYHDYLEIVDAWKPQFAERGIVFDGESQGTLDWESDGCPCRGTPDHVVFRGNSATIYDLKTCEDASPRKCQRAFADWGYHIQEAAYVEALETLRPELAGRIDFRFLFCEVEPPYAVSVVEASGAFKALGRHDWGRAKSIWSTCLKRGEWPAYSIHAETVEPPVWLISKATEEGYSHDEAD